MLKLDSLNEALYMPLKQVDVGFATKQALYKASGKMDGNPLLGQQFKTDCITSLSSTTKKLLEESPLNYAAVSLMSSLDPVLMVTKEEKVINILKSSSSCCSIQSGQCSSM
ncbi:unnamed protein product [Merluccius merluccius]